MDQLHNYRELIDSLHAKWQPHEGQIKPGRALFNDGKRNIFIQCGRKWGKTEIIEYCLYRWAAAHPNSSCYYISPFQKQSKEIIWANRRLHNFIDHKYIKSINSTELRITLTNGSFIKCDGSDNYEAYRGIEPHFVVFEEFKDFKPDFYIAMEPNLSVYNSPLMIIGTPPTHDCQFTQIAEEHRADPTKFFMEGKTEENPFISKEWLSKKREELIRRGEWDVWEREYCGRYIKGGSSKILPMISETMIHKHEDLLAKIYKDKKKLKKYCFADPAGASVFGVLFTMINPYTKEIFFLDEIYETSQAKMTVNNIGRQIVEKTNELYPARNDDDWYYGYDEAATWFANEMSDHFQINMIPTQKASNKKESGLSLIKDAMLAGKVHFSDRCAKLYWEMDNYIKDSKGNIPKVNDHQIDNARYTLAADMYDLIGEKVETLSREDKFMKVKISDDFPELDDFGNIDNDNDSIIW